jgi:hypothetical protein
MSVTCNNTGSKTRGWLYKDDKRPKSVLPTEDIESGRLHVLSG